MANIVSYEAKDGQSVELTFETIKKFLVHGRPEYVTNQEMIFFMGICKARGLNPFAKDCYLMKYTESDPAAIITSIDFFRSRARAQKDCKGWQAGIIVENKEGNIRYSNGLIKKDETLLGGWFKGRPEGWENDFDLEVNLDGYIKKTRQGDITKFWKPENQPTMIRKVAESQGLRELWPDEFAKVYVEEEVDRTEMRDKSLLGDIDMEKSTDKNGKDIYNVKSQPQDTEGKEPIPTPSKSENSQPDASQEGKEPEKSLFEILKGARPSASGKALADWKILIEEKADEIKEFSMEQYRYIYKKWQKACPGKAFPARPSTKEETKDPEYLPPGYEPPPIGDDPDLSSNEETKPSGKEQVNNAHIEKAKIFAGAVKFAIDTFSDETNSKILDEFHLASYDDCPEEQWYDVKKRINQEADKLAS